MSPNPLANKYYAGKKYVKCLKQNNVILHYIIMILCQTIVKYYIFIVPLGFPLSSVSYLFILVCYLSGYNIRHYVWCNYQFSYILKKQHMQLHMSGNFLKFHRVWNLLWYWQATFSALKNKHLFEKFIYFMSRHCGVLLRKKTKNCSSASTILLG